MGGLKLNLPERVKLRPHQLDALKRMQNGCVLWGEPGSGKSRTGLAYYFSKQGKYMRDLYIITTALKRDNLEWEVDELNVFDLSTDPNHNKYNNKVTIDSWNNIKKYENVRHAFFIFDEQRVVGYGVWAKAFIKIAHNNDWILLSGTPGDGWMDYIALFIANGFYRNKTQFEDMHVRYKRGVPYKMVDQFFGTKRLEKYRDAILIEMPMERQTVQHHENIPVNYDRHKYKEAWISRFNPEKGEPFKNAGEMAGYLRKILNTDESRSVAVQEICEQHQRVIIFYNCNYELEILRSIPWREGTAVREWNGHMHQPLPLSESRWVYLVQYTAGAEGWNCTCCDTIIFYSSNYSWKIMKQAAGRIDRLTNVYKDLYYYHLISTGGIDRAIAKALRDKKEFNERKYLGWKNEKQGRKTN